MKNYLVTAAYTVIGVLLMWCAFNIFFEVKIRTLKSSTKPISVLKFGSTTIDVISNDVINPENPGQDFQYDSFVSTVPSNEGNWRSGTKSLSVLPLSVLTSLAISEGLLQSPSEEMIKKLLNQAVAFLVQEKKIPVDQLLEVDIVRQLKTEMIFWHIDKMKASNDFRKIYKLYNNLLETNIGKPISIKVNNLPHFSDYDIKQVILLPVFNYKNNSANFSNIELNDRISSGVKNAFFHINKDVHKLAFPALAGTETRIDSKYYLTYDSSFSAILQGIYSVPKEINTRNIETIYLVVWNKLRTINQPEFNRAYKGLKSAIIKQKFATSSLPCILLILLLVLTKELFPFFKKRETKNIKIAGAAVITVFLWATSLLGNMSWISKLQQKSLVSAGQSGLILFQCFVVFTGVIIINNVPSIIKFIEEANNELKNSPTKGAT